MGLFDSEPLSKPEDTRWTPSEPPSLDGVSEVVLDFETEGLRWWDGDRAVGVAVGYQRPGEPFRSQYLPMRHAGGNLPYERVREWMIRELRGKRIRGAHVKFDAHVSREEGVDLELLGCKLTDICHTMALLDDHRRTFNLEDISQDILGVGKIKGLDKKRMVEYHAGSVYKYAERDVTLPHLLAEKLLPRIKAEELEAVHALEDAVIFPVLEMEKNGAPINEELLDRWVKRSEQEYLKGLMDIRRETGVKLNPKSSESMAELFRKLGLRNLAVTDTGGPSFRDEHLRTFTHPIVQRVRRLRKIASMKSKFLDPYQEDVKHNGGILRYALHQLRGDEEHGGGTVTGRFSSSGYRTGTGEPDGVNVQQVAEPKRQRLAFGYAEDDASHDDEIYLIRQLFVPREGLWLSADARQIEYRLFAHYANSPKILAAYEKDPLTDFHALVMAMIKPILQTITRKKAKDINFAKIYGAGIKKIAAMLGISISEAMAFVDAYDRAFPEVPVLIERAMRAAESRGFVKTLLGRRSRFINGFRSHKALNSVIQGGAADINKRKLVELHEARKQTGFLMRFTVHDEVDGDCPDEESARKVQEILDRQSYPLRVPILWDVSTGADWRQCA